MPDESTTPLSSAASDVLRQPLATGTARTVVKRRIEAPPAEVFAAWLDAEGMRKWMCPANVRESRVTIDPRVGGHYRIDMVGATEVYEHEGEYLVIDPPRRLSFTWISPSTNRERSVVTIEFTDRGGATDLVLTHERLPSDDMARRHNEGWASILEKLAARFAN
ncbi:MAG TPA: SRPBCC domain-containing protein [Gemmatimonadaceae bacterium]|nr:SRPBCC domain-containing protein [Gemmatimonadaceae bacterium]